MLSVVKSLLPFCTRFCISLNGYDNIPEELVELKKSSDKIITVLTGKGHNVKDLGNLNKMYWLGDFPGYYATVDDDIIYPPNYIQTLKNAVDRYDKKAIVSFHGHIYKSVNGKINVRDKQLLWYKLKHDT